MWKVLFFFAEQSDIKITSKEQDVKNKAFYNNLQSRLFLPALFLLFVLLARLFPYSGDDWAWGSQLGLERLQSLFEGYNGRYAGNLLVMALTRSKLLASCVVGLFLTLACALPKNFARGKGLSSYALGAVMLLTLPRGVFTQAVVWTSGFSNYIPPVIITMIYFVVVKNIFEKDKPVYKKYTGALCAVLGFVGALFMENLTLFNIAIAIVIIADTYRRHRSFYLPHILYFTGSVAGAVLMFSNSAYGIIARGEDFYRSTLVERGVLDTVTENFRQLFDNLLADNLIGITVFSLLCALTCYALKKEGDEKAYRISLRALLCNGVAFTAIACKGRLDDWELVFESRSYALISTALIFAVATAYLVSAGVILFYGIKDSSLKNKALFVYVCIPLSAAPLMVVNPVGPRCFFPHCFMLSVVCVTVLAYLLRVLKPEPANEKRLCTLLVASTTAVFCFLTGVYSVIHSYDVERNEYAKKQADAGFKTVVTYYLPFSSYVWNGDPDCAPWNDDYKQFHNIPDKVKFKFILRESFSDFAENFEQ